MKGFKDKNKKFHPTNPHIRKKRIPVDKMVEPKVGVRINSTMRNEGIRLKRDRRPNLKSSDVIVVPNHGQIMSALQKLKEKSRWGNKGDTREQNIDESNSYSEGFDRGLSFAESAFDDIGQLKIGTDISKLDFGASEFELGFKILENKDDFEDFIRQSAYMAEENDREFSPFEITARELQDREFNEEGEQISNAFDAYQDGIGEAINWYVSWVFEHNEDLVQ